MIFSRGSVALRPPFLRSCGEVMASGGAARGVGADAPVDGYNNGSLRFHRSVTHIPPPERDAAALDPVAAALLRRCARCRALLGGCPTLDTVHADRCTSFGVYKLDINQGNFLSQDMVDKLKVGQTPAQVKLMLGTPLIASAFRDRPLGLCLRVHAAGPAGRASQFHRLFRRRQARALGGRRNAAVGRRAQPRRAVAKAAAATKRRAARASGIVCSTLSEDTLRDSDAATSGSRSPAPAAGWGRR